MWLLENWKLYMWLTFYFDWTALGQSVLEHPVIHSKFSPRSLTFWVSELFLNAYWRPHRYLCLWRRYSVYLKRQCLSCCLFWQQVTWTRGTGSSGETEVWGAQRKSSLPLLWEVCSLSPHLPVVAEPVRMSCSWNSMAHRFCVGCRLQQLNPRCGLQITLSCILCQPQGLGIGENVPWRKNIGLWRGNVRTCLPCMPGPESSVSLPRHFLDWLKNLDACIRHLETSHSHTGRSASRALQLLPLWLHSAAPF